MNNCISSINQVNFYISRDLMSMGRQACKAHVEGDTGSGNGAKVSGWEWDLCLWEGEASVSGMMCVRQWAGGNRGPRNTQVIQSSSCRSLDEFWVWWEPTGGVWAIGRDFLTKAPAECWVRTRQQGAGREANSPGRGVAESREEEKVAEVLQEEVRSKLGVSLQVGEVRSRAVVSGSRGFL